MGLGDKKAMIPWSYQLGRLRIKGSLVMCNDTLELLARSAKVKR